MAGTGAAAGSTNTLDLEDDIRVVDEYVLSDADTVTTRETPTFPAGKVLLTLEGLRKAALDGVGARIYPTVAAGEADSTNGTYFWVVSSDPSAALELWLMGASTATDTGKKLYTNFPQNVILY